MAISAAFIEALRKLLLHEPEPSTIAPSPRARRARAGRIAVWLALLAGLFAAGILLGCGFFLFGRRPLPGYSDNYAVTAPEPRPSSRREPPPETKASPPIPTREDEWQTVNSVGMKLVRLPTGKFLMGSPKNEQERQNDEEQHEVEISRTYWIGTTTVSQDEYEKVMGTNPSAFSATGQEKMKVANTDTHRFPVENVSWDDAVEFCAKLSQRPEEVKAKRTYRLPTEAEWEYACRAGTIGYAPFHCGNTLTSMQANFNGYFPYPANAKKGPNLGRPSAVGSYDPSKVGLYDMAGNVWQWCQDWYGPYDPKDAKDPTGPGTGQFRVVRGGNWSSHAKHCRAARRDSVVPTERVSTIGFRVACVVP
jgi:formylglycine-generating enzyme required for sulfatase activity